MAVLLLASAKILVGLGVWVGTAAWRGPSPNLFFSWYYLLQVAVFCGAAAPLIAGGRDDARARALGTLLILYATLFVDPLLRQAMALAPSPSTFVTALYHLVPIAFSPAYSWEFGRQFPRPLAEPRWPLSPKAVARLGFIIGWVLVVANLAVPFTSSETWLGSVSAWLSGRHENGHLWEILIVLSLPVFGLIISNFRASEQSERRRVRLFLAGFIAGVLPLNLDILLASLVPAYRDFTRAPDRLPYIGVGLGLALFIWPVVTVYAVLVTRVFGVRFFVRKAIQYAFARYTVLALLAIPGVALVSYGYANRHRSVGELLTLQPSVGWLLLIATGLALTFGRRPLLDWLDRRFFREEYDARRILMDLVEGSRQAGSVGGQAALTVLEIDRALHVTTAGMLIADPAQDAFVDPQGHLLNLPYDSPLAALIGGSGTPLDASVSRSTMDRLPASDRAWLDHARARLLVPLMASDRSLLGVIAVGEKLSEAPFSDEDIHLLTSVAASTALALEHRVLIDAGLRASPSQPNPSGDDQPARQCSWCGVVQAPEAGACGRCGGPLETARLPRVLNDAFAVERQIGRGGMGVVYLGRDLKLDRSVALKTLPRVSVSSVKRLTNEAMAMAALADPHLAVIYGAETWRGSPVLVLEYLAGGTLSDRLAAGPIAIEEVIALGLAMSNALDALHRSGFLHRDVKPSNIGYTRAGMPKLMDFGLAKLVTGVPRVPAARKSSTLAARSARATAVSTAQGDTASHHLAGTAAYLAPDVLAMEPPAASLDLWSLAVTMYEALTGRNPFLGADADETFTLIGAGVFPDPQTLRSDCPNGLAAFLRNALSPRREDRPSSARLFNEALSRSRSDLALV